MKVAGDAGPEARAEIATAIDAEDVTTLPGGWRAYSLPQPQTADEVRADLAGAEAAVRVQLPARVRALGPPNDPLFAPVDNGYQWGLRNVGYWGGDVPGADISAVEGWSRVSDPAPVTVAVVDTGVQITHPDLADRIWTNPGEIPGNGVDDDHDGKVDDVNGWDFSGNNASVFDDPTGDRHGTHVAGVIAARRGNGVGIAGIADNARIMPLKFIGADGSGWNVNAIYAIQYAVAKGAKVINASFGGSTYDPALCDAIAWAGSQGVLVVVAAGNTGQNLDAADTWPAKCPSPTMLTVGAMTHTGGLASFSNRSATQVDIAAPGEWIVSTVPGGYDTMSGTSMATPHVAGVAAAVLGQSPALTPSQARQVILDGSVPMPALAGLVAGGRRLDLDGALAQAGMPRGADTEAPAAFALGAPADGTALADRRPTFRWEASSDAGSGLAYYRVTVDGRIVADRVTALQARVAQPLAAGTHTWSVEAVDAEGNATRSEARTLRIDTLAPSRFSLLQPAPGLTAAAGRVTVRWSAASDGGSGLARYEVLVDRRVVASVPGDATSAPVTVAAGRHAVAVRAVDGAGNQTSTASRALTALRAGKADVRVAPARARVGSRPVIRVRSPRAGSASLDVRAADGTAIGGLRVRLRRGETAVTLPAALSSRLGSGAYTVVLRPDAASTASGTLRVTG
ncbi:MAG: S8 family serine peptidase [Thermoleophilia bacterium]